jgi:hypothetical protein
MMMNTKLVEMNGEMVLVKVMKPSRRKAGLGLTKAKHQVGSRGAVYLAREGGQFVR